MSRARSPQLTVLSSSSCDPHYSGEDRVRAPLSWIFYLSQECLDRAITGVASRFIALFRHSSEHTEGYIGVENIGAR